MRQLLAECSEHLVLGGFKQGLGGHLVGMVVAAGFRIQVLYGD